MRRGGGQGAWARLERGELTLEQFYEPFAAEVAATTAAPVTADTVRDFMAALVRGLGTTDPEMMEAVTRLKAAGYKVAVLTNNWRSEQTGRLMLGAEESAVFDAVVESCVVRMRKPEEEIYRHTLAQLGVAAEEAVFLDDIAGNLRPAEQLGLAVVRVRDATSALAELQQLLGLDLGVTAGTARIRPGMEIDQARLQHYLQDKLQLSGTSTKYLVPAPHHPALCRPADGAPVPARAVQPHLPGAAGRRQVRPQEEAAGPAAARGARHREGGAGDGGPRQTRRARAQAAGPLRGCEVGAGGPGAG